jgi:hypothetical protein
VLIQQIFRPILNEVFLVNCQIKQIERNLLEILFELKEQSDVSSFFSDKELSFEELVKQLEEYISLAGEYAIAYEVIVCTLEKYPFKLSGKCSVRLLEIGLIMGYKTDREEDLLYQIKS